MSELSRISLTLPKELLDELDEILKAQDYASRSEAIRDALRDFLTSYRWRSELKGKQIGAIVVMYDHSVRGLSDLLTDIQHRYSGVVLSVQHLHMDAKNCLETLMVKGQAKKIRKLGESIGALRGVKQVKLIPVGK